MCFSKIFSLTLLIILAGCAENTEPSAFNKDQYEEQLRLMCPCRMFSDEQRDIFKQLESLDYFVVVPASGIGVQDSIRLEKSTHYGVRVSNSCYINKQILGAADTDRNRFRKFNNAAHTNHKILWALRGGYGSYRLIDFMEKSPPPKNGKIFIGFSDTTALSLFISKNWKNWKVIHAPVFIHLVNQNFHKPSFDLLMKILHGSVSEYSIDGLEPLNEAAKTAEKISGKTTGGNLSILETSLAADWEIQTKNKIVFLEDVGERAEKIHRMLHHLKQAGKFKRAKAVVFGAFSESLGDVGGVLRAFADGLRIPVYMTGQFGHGKVNMPIVCNADSEICGGKWTIILSRDVDD